MGKKSALVLGASGLIGSEVLTLCLESDTYTKVIAPVRSPLFNENEKLTEKVIDFEMPPWEDLFPVDHVYCCLGTTIKTAGSKTNFRKVDHDYPLAFAGAGKKWNTSVFSVITAAGSNANSRIFYNRVKEELEANLKSLALTSTLIFQPSFLMGDRHEFRLGEKMVVGVAKLTSWMIPKSVRPISAKTVAKAMFAETQSERTGFHIISNNNMHNNG
ncbi:hypothetical protein JYT44_01580 [Caldithrix abyssi]|nr:hypothetical protein [Caldithrix abyssi]